MKTAAVTDLKNIVAWSVSMVEIASAIERRTRDGSLTPLEHDVAQRAARELAAAWTEVSALVPVRDRAVRLVATHPIRAADAMQLAAALVAVADRPAGHSFVCTDGRLREAAGREGFVVLPEACRAPRAAGVARERRPRAVACVRLVELEAFAGAAVRRR